GKLLPGGHLKQRFVLMSELLTGVKGSFQSLDVGRNAGNSVDPHFIHPSPFDLLHTLPNDERDFGAFTPEDIPQEVEFRKCLALLCYC
uniref:Uncharacterized protein n=1 Tax=Oryzias melastigma TaxID=30732 RepID=A0A3B3CQX2_ORYME